MTSFAVYNLERNNTFDYSKAKKVLGYHTCPYTETIRDEVQWLQQEGKDQDCVNPGKEVNRILRRNKKILKNSNCLKFLGGVKLYHII